jgi:hypothetical protein
MNPEEAVLQLELIGHDFFVFRSDDSGEINVIYRRRNGGYGLIEPLGYFGGGRPNDFGRRFRRRRGRSPHLLYAAPQAAP